MRSGICATGAAWRSAAHRTASRLARCLLVTARLKSHRVTLTDLHCQAVSTHAEFPYGGEIFESIATEGESVKSMRRAFGVVAGASGAAAMAIGLAPAHTAPGASDRGAPDTSVAAIENAIMKANDPSSGLLEKMSHEEWDLLKSSNAASVLLDAKTGEVLSFGEGDFVPKVAAPRAQPMSQVPG